METLLGHGCRFEAIVAVDDSLHGLRGINLSDQPLLRLLDKAAHSLFSDYWRVGTEEDSFTYICGSNGSFYKKLIDVLIHRPTALFSQDRLNNRLAAQAAPFVLNYSLHMYSRRSSIPRRER